MAGSRGDSGCGSGNGNGSGSESCRNRGSNVECVCVVVAVFVASGICSGWLPGVKFHDNKAIVSSRVIFGETGESKLITNEYDL